MDGLKPKSVAGRAVAENGVVLLDGPDGVAVAMTPDCAEQTALQLLAAARDAVAQSTTDQGSGTAG